MAENLLKDVINLIKQFDKSIETFNKDIDGFKEWVSTEFEKESIIYKENSPIVGTSNNLFFSEKEIQILFLIKIRNKNLINDHIILDYEDSIENLINENFIIKKNNQLLLTAKGNNYLYRDIKFIFEIK